MRLNSSTAGGDGGAAALETVMTEILPALLQAFPDGVEELATPFEVPQILVEPGRLVAVCEWLKARGFNQCSDVGGVDYLPRNPRFEVVYHFLAIPALWRLRLRVPIADGKPEVPSISGLWPSANWAEREVFDLFGIRFTQHPNLKRILMPDDYEGSPLRKDFPLRGSRPAPVWGQAPSQAHEEKMRIAQARIQQQQLNRVGDGGTHSVTQLPRGK